MDYLKLFWIRLKTDFYDFAQWYKVIWRYYVRSWTFLKIDLMLLVGYLFRNPFRLSKRFLLAKGSSQVDVYGETPLTTLEKIADICAIRSEDTVFELGSGRGRGCFWLHQFRKCKVVGIEWLPEFVQKANKVKEKFRLEGIEFRLQDMTTADLKGATVVYLYGTCLGDVEIRSIVKQLKKLPRGTKVITVSYSLVDYVERQLFEVVRAFPAQFTWGEGFVYLHTRI